MVRFGKCVYSDWMDTCTGQSGTLESFFNAHGLFTRNNKQDKILRNCISAYSNDARIYPLVRTSGPMTSLRSISVHWWLREGLPSQVVGSTSHHSLNKDRNIHILTRHVRCFFLCFLWGQLPITVSIKREKEEMIFEFLAWWKKKSKIIFTPLFFLLNVKHT